MDNQLTIFGFQNIPEMLFLGYRNVPGWSVWFSSDLTEKILLHKYCITLVVGCIFWFVEHPLNISNV